MYARETERPCKNVVPIEVRQALRVRIGKLEHDRLFAWHAIFIIIDQ
jgi:hypothetical protein